MQDLQRQIDELKSSVEQIQSSDILFRNNETALRERLGIDLIPKFLYGSAAMTGGAYILTDSRIKTTSIAVTTWRNNQSPAQTISALASTGSIAFNSSDATDTRTFLYIIIL